FARNGIDALRITERCALESKLALDLRQLLLFLLNFFNSVAVLNPLIMLPAVGKQAEQKHGSQCGNNDVIAMALRVGFADDVVIDDTFFEMDFDSHQLLSQARNFALRERGLN